MENNKFRIIAGTHRGRLLSFPSAPGLRITPDRVRETLFNWLQNKVKGKSFLDLFAGSGTLVFEALSRGGATATAVEINRLSIKKLEDNKKILKIDNLNIIKQSAFNYIDVTKESFDFIFLDPPFNQNLIPKTLNALSSSNAIQTGSKIYIEQEKKIYSKVVKRHLGPNANIVRQARAGNVYYGIIEI